MGSIPDNLQAVKSRIDVASRASGRDPRTVRLLAVSKTHPPERVREAYAAGQRAFGENYVQEALDKMAALADLALEWHLVGPLQSNKTRVVAERFDWVHTVDRERIARRLDAQRPHFAKPLNVLIQLNLDGEPQKAGVPAAEVPALAELIASLPRLALRGLMTIPPAGNVWSPGATFLYSRSSVYAVLPVVWRNTSLTRNSRSVRVV